jgi:hypothetical protein
MKTNQRLLQSSLTPQIQIGRLEGASHAESLKQLGSLQVSCSRLVNEEASGPVDGQGPLARSLFHEHWWLSAVSGGHIREVTVKSGERVVGRLPFMDARSMGLRISRMPAFTHVLGPVVDIGSGKPQTQLRRHYAITTDLIDQLPHFAFFTQTFESSTTNALAFQRRGFDVSTQYTLQVNCRDSVANIWGGMRDKTRNLIRRADEEYSVISLGDSGHFITFYLDNLKKSGCKNRMQFEYFPTVFSECQARGSGELLAAFTPSGTPAAMVFLVWGSEIMYYLLSTRAPDIASNGAISLLLWKAMHRAHQMNKVFDLDGIYSSGSFRFLSGFGGYLQTRIVVKRIQPFYSVARFARRTFSLGREHSTFMPS